MKNPSAAAPTPLTAPSVGIGHDHDFAAALLASSDNRRKGERTRLALLASGCGLLDATPLPALTVASICKAANVAHGTFYLYFADRHAFLADLLAAFIGFVQLAMRREARRAHDRPERASTAAYSALFEANPGIMRCLVHHLDEFPEARTAFQRLNREWAETVTRSTERSRRSRGLPALAHDELLRRAYALGGMVDQYLAALHLAKDPSLVAISADRDAVIDTLTSIWTKGMDS